MLKASKLNWKRLTIVSVLSGIVYNSWPVGYWLNPYVAQHDLASGLEGLHEPFNWVFIGGDIVSSLLLIAAALILLIKLRKYTKSGLILIALANAIAFGVGTILDALIPLNCDPTVQRCQTLWHNPIMLIHGLFSILASVCLFVTMAIFWWLDRKSHIIRVIVVGYILFGIFSILSILLPGQDSWAQHYSLLLDGVCIAVIPFITAQLLNKSQS